MSTSLSDNLTNYNLLKESNKRIKEKPVKVLKSIDTKYQCF